MKTSNKILLTAFGILIGIILAGMITTRSMIFSSMIKGDGNITESERTVESFERIRIKGKFKVNYTQAESTSVVLRADANLHDYIITEVNNNELLIRSRENLRSKNDMEIDISSASLSHVEASAAAHFLTSQPLQLNELELLANAGAYMNVEGTFARLSVYQNAGAQVYLSGNADRLDVTSNAGGTVNAAELVAVSAKADANAGASITVNCAELEASANAGGAVKYTGNPVVRNMSTNAGGSINRID